MTRRMFAFLALALMALTSGQGVAQPQDCDNGTFEGAFADEVLLPQNWDCAERQAFWFTDQGSEIIPYNWFLHLEQADSREKFVDPGHIDGFRYLPQSPTSANPDGLPIGFTRGSVAADSANGRLAKHWLGMTCAACHTGQIEHEGRKYLIDGAPAMADFEGLFIALAEAMQATLDDPQKFDRFADAVIASGDGGTEDKDELRVQLRMMTDLRTDWNQRNRGRSRYGHARLDAIGAIFNEIAATGLGNSDNVDFADAPVSYPFIWDTPQHDVVQWNGSVPNAGPGSLGRNVGEVLGVFGALDLNTSRISRRGHRTSVDIDGLATLEGLMWTLWSPRWQDTDLPPIDQALAERGKADYERLCRGCHALIKREDPERRIKAMMVPVSSRRNPDNPNALGTDPTMAENFLEMTAKAPELTHRFRRYWAVLSDFQRFKRSERDATPKNAILGYAVIGAITNSFLQDPRATLRALKVGQPSRVAAVLDAAYKHVEDEPGIHGVRRFLREVKDKLETDASASPSPCALDRKDPIPCYKARPLNGIWATAPYLHNGSVRTLRQLLLPPNERDASFKVGTRAFDPVEVGFVDDGASTLDTTLPGNAKSGHGYGSAALVDDPERMNALLEYLKTL